MTRIGPQMQRAIDIVAGNPGCTIRFVAKQLHIGAATGRANAYGYDPVNRAIQAGRITAKRGARNSYALFVV